MRAGHGHVQVLALDARALILHHADSDALDVEHRPEREDRLIGGDGLIWSKGSTTCRDAFPLPADVRVLLAAIRGTLELSSVYELQAIRQHDLCFIGGFLQVLDRLFVPHGPRLPVLQAAPVDDLLALQVVNAGILQAELCAVDSLQDDQQAQDSLHSPSHSATAFLSARSMPSGYSLSN